MKILLILKKNASLTGAGTYEAVIAKELAKRHEVTIYRSEKDLEGDWDIAHCTDLKHLSFKLARKLRCPLVVDAHDYYWVKYYHFFCLDFPLRFLLQKVRKLKYDLLFKHIDGIILHGQFLYDVYEHPHKYLNFYFGLDYAKRPERPWAERENLILFVGGDFFRKGLPRLLKALPQVITTVPDARVLVIGTDVPYARWFAKWLSRKLPVDFIYGMPREEVFALYARAKVLVLPSEIEATPIVISEAVIAGIPPVVSLVGGHPELVQDGETGYVFPLGDSALLAQRLITCLTDGAESQRLVRQGQQFFSRFSIPGMLDQLESVFTSVIQRVGK